MVLLKLLNSLPDPVGKDDGRAVGSGAGTTVGSKPREGPLQVSTDFYRCPFRDARKTLKIKKSM